MSLKLLTEVLAPTIGVQNLQPLAMVNLQPRFKGLEGFKGFALYTQQVEHRPACGVIRKGNVMLPTTQCGDSRRAPQELASAST